MPLLALSCVPYIIEDALVAKLLCLYHTSSSWHTTPFFRLLQKLKCLSTVVVIPPYLRYPFTQHIRSPSNSNSFETTLIFVSRISCFKEPLDF